MLSINLNPDPRRLLLLPCLVFFLVSSGAGQTANLENLKLLLKDTATYSRAAQGNFDHPALAIGLKRDYTIEQTVNYPIRVAIDPGAVATNRREAIIEERFLNSRYGFFFESDLNLATALLLKELFEARGFEVMLTRLPNMSAYGDAFLKWFRRSFKDELDADLRAGRITQERHESLKRAPKQEVFDKYFKPKDLLARGAKINAFAPDVTLSIHFNSSEFENSPERVSPEVGHTYSVCFVPGGFTNAELKREEHLEDFIRLASTDAIAKSVRLAGFIAKEFETKLGAPMLEPGDMPGLWYLDKYSVYSKTPGVYSRNLYITRAVQSPICYGECLLQNNVDEIKGLAQRDFAVGPLKVSARVKDVADCYYSGVLKYFNFLTE